MEEEDTFRMLILGGMSTKTKQLEWVRMVRSAATTAYKKFNDED